MFEIRQLLVGDTFLTLSIGGPVIENSYFLALIVEHSITLKKNQGQCCKMAA